MNLPQLNKVLIIEDSKTTRLLYRDMIHSMGIANEIDVCKSGNDALDYLKGKQGKPPIPDLIFLDIMMDDMDGLTFMQKYSELEESITNNFEIVIVVVSDYLNHENLTTSKYYKSYGVVGHIKKPMDEEDVKEILEEFFTITP